MIKCWAGFIIFTGLPVQAIRLAGKGVERAENRRTFEDMSDKIIVLSPLSFLFFPLPWVSFPNPNHLQLINKQANLVSRMACSSSTICARSLESWEHSCACQISRHPYEMISVILTWASSPSFLAVPAIDIGLEVSPMGARLPLIFVIIVIVVIHKNGVHRATVRSVQYKM